MTRWEHAQLISNDYSQATPVERGLFVVQMSDGGWSIADGPGTQLLFPDELQSAGYHLPVRFASQTQATQALLNGPSAWFDVHPESPWVRHCIESGGEFYPQYLRRSGPSDLSTRSG